MGKEKVFYLCGQCGYKSSKWLGKCPQCREWNSFIEEVELPKDGQRSAPSANIQPVLLQQVEYSESDRMLTGIAEFDRVLGGIVPGQAVLLSGEPGIGKSTLLLSVALHFTRQGKIFYINGEESDEQVKSRAVRMGIESANLFLLPSTDPEDLSEILRRERPAVVFADSVQTLRSRRYESYAGSVVQVRECAQTMTEVCKQLSIPLFLVSHITKSGTIAGPKVVEHIMDTVLYLESDARGYYRILRSLKNRFFTTDEIGFFHMTEKGLQGVENIHSAFVIDHEDEVSGIALFPFIEGNRAFPVEVQALVTPSRYNLPRRAADGMDPNRLTLLVAILEKSLKLNFASFDIYVNITGGLKIDDPALDLPVLFAIYSSYKNRPAVKDTVAVGEVGLTGEVRPVSGLERRSAEMERLGFQRMIFPLRNKNTRQPGSLRLMPVKDLREGIELL